MSLMVDGTVTACSTATWSHHAWLMLPSRAPTSMPISHEVAGRRLRCAGTAQDRPPQVGAGQVGIVDETTPDPKITAVRAP